MHKITLILRRPLPEARIEAILDGIDALIVNEQELADKEAACGSGSVLGGARGFGSGPDGDRLVGGQTTDGADRSNAQRNSSVGPSLQEQADKAAAEVRDLAQRAGLTGERTPGFSEALEEYLNLRETVVPSATTAAVRRSKRMCVLRELMDSYAMPF